MTSTPPVTEVKIVQQDDRRIWPIVVSVGSSLLSAGLATILCLNVSARNAERGREARAELQRTVCSIIVAQDDNYHDNAPQTPLGKANARSMAQLRVTLGCPQND